MLKRIIWALALLSLLLAAVAGWFWHDYQQFIHRPLVLTQTRILEVKRGSTLGGLAAELEQAGELGNRYYLLLLARLQFAGKAIKAGAYELTPPVTPEQLLTKLINGQVIQYRISLIEGWSFRQMRAAVERDPHLLQTAKDWSDAELMQRLGHPGLMPEGRFFPDTYVFGYQAEDMQVFKQALAAMEQKLALHWQQRASNLPYQNANDALTMASIIEKETGLRKEQNRVAGVFVRRLQQGMKLQTDPSVIYGLGSGFDGNLRKKDLQQPTPYNTYVISGLPPTPICMPGEAAIQAAMHPDQSNALYFVANGQGGHVFSDTLEQHNAAVRRYLQQLKQKDQ